MARNPYDRTKKGVLTMLLDTFLPVYDFNEVHVLRVRAEPDKVFCAIKEVTPREAPVFLLLGLRGTQPLIDQMLRTGFVILGEETNRELVLGTIDRFWKPRRSSSARIRGPQEFGGFDDPGYAKAAMNFRVDGSNNSEGSRITTETRIHATDSLARKKFAAYWRLIAPGSAISRRYLLKAIKRRAERPT